MEKSSNKLMHDLRTVVIDAEDLLKATASQTGERVEQVRLRAEESLRLARDGLHDAGAKFDAQVHQNPWTAIGVAAGIGLILGVLLGRK